MKKLTSHGFAAVEALLVIIILAIIGGTGYFVLHARQNADMSLDSASSSKQATVVKTGNVADFAACKAAKGSKLLETYPEQCVTKDGKKFTDTSTVSGQFLVIKEWGIKLPLSDGISDAYYSFDSTGHVVLSLNSLRNTGCSAAGGAMGMMTRFIDGEKDPAFDELYAIRRPDARKIGNYYYYYQGPQAVCSDDTAVQDKANAVLPLFGTAVQNAVAI